MPFGPTHTFLRALARSATQSFFDRIEVIDGENVPRDGPLIVCCSHSNSAVDPAVLSCFFPSGRKLHYWAKSTLFKPGFPARILLDAGNLPVDRRTKDNQRLFASTFDALKLGEAIAIFPEGTSTTAPSLLPLKDGASWAALEYAKNIRSPEGKSLSGEGGGTIEGDLPDVTIAIAGISYTDKTKYRSGAVMKFAPSVRVADYVDEFLGEDPKAAVKRMTADIDRALRGVTINAPDFDTLTAAHMARKILWVNERSLPLRHLRDVGQTLVDMFSPEATATSEAAMKVKQTLLAYDAILRETGLTHHALSGVPLPETLDPSVPHPMPTRARALGTLILQTLRSLVYLAFFAFPLVVHLPLYAIARFSTKLSPDEEDISQNKIATGLVIALFVYSTVFALVYAWQPPAITVTSPTASLASLLTTAVVVPLSIVIGAIVAAGLTSLFVMYHNRTVTRNYDGAKRLVAGWRVLAGLWTGSETNVRRALKIRAAAAVELRSYIRTQADVSPRAAQLVAYGARLSSSPATAAALRSDVTNRQRRATSGSDTSASTPKLVHRFSATSVETSSLPPTPSLASDFATGFSPAS